MPELPRNLVFAVCKDRLLSLSFRRLVKFDKRKSRLLHNCDELACYGKRAVGRFENKCPTNFSLSPSLDQLKLVGHQTDLLPEKSE
jgi:hypothetical protein